MNKNNNLYFLIVGIFIGFCIGIFDFGYRLVTRSQIHETENAIVYEYSVKKEE